MTGVGCLDDDAAPRLQAPGLTPLDKGPCPRGPFDTPKEDGLEEVWRTTPPSAVTPSSHARDWVGCRRQGLKDVHARQTRPLHPCRPPEQRESLRLKCNCLTPLHPPPGTAALPSPLRVLPAAPTEGARLPVEPSTGKGCRQIERVDCLSGRPTCGILNRPIYKVAWLFTAGLDRRPSCPRLECFQQRIPRRRDGQREQHARRGRCPLSQRPEPM